MNEKKVEKKQNKGLQDRSYHKRRIVLDSVVFLIIVVITSLAMIMISSGLEGSNSYYKNYPGSEEYIEISMQSILSSTVPEVSYYDLVGARTVFSGQTIEGLIQTDLAVRGADTINFNLSSLEQGLESRIKTTINSVFLNKNYILIAEPETTSTGDDRIYITNMQTAPKLTNLDSPNFEKRLGSSWSDEDDAGNVGNNDIIVRLYLL